MSEARTLKIKSSLATKLAQPGGRSLKDAERLALEGLERRRDDVLVEIQGVIGELEVLCVGQRPEEAMKVYELGSTIIDLAGFFDTGPLYKAAYSLCDLSEQMAEAGVWRWPAVEVHVQTLRLIHASGCKAGPEATMLLNGLNAVLQATK